MTHSIDRAAVIGAGVMGATLAAHLTNAGIPTLLLDIVPPEDSGVEGDRSSREYRDAFANTGLKKALAANPKAFYVDEKARLVTTGNIEDDVERLKDTDWVLEAVTERLDVKESLFKHIAPHLKPTAILSSNTSGLSVEAMAQMLAEPLRKRFLVTHFFNPPRYMHLLEIVPHSATDPDVARAVAQFGEDVLGKGVVWAKDTPNFIANRIGAFSMALTLRIVLEDGYTIEEADALTGPVIGRPKSATFRTADLVGLDTLAHTSDTVYNGAESDESRGLFKKPEIIEQMLAKGMLGEKSGLGFYKKTKKDGKTEILTLDFASLDYRPRKRPAFASLEMARNIDDVGERILAVVKSKDRAADFVWKLLSGTLVYAANRVGEIADDIVQIDNAIKWGFNWVLGPFELWDLLGAEKVAERLEKDGQAIPKVVSEVLQTESKRFYTEADDFKRYFFVSGNAHEPVHERDKFIDLALLKKQKRVIKGNAGASLIDIGDGILCLEFHSKMNAIGSDIIGMIHHAVKETEANHEGLVIGNQGSNFSVGANLMLLLLEAQDGNWEDIDVMIRSFQKASQAMKYCKRPVVAAPFGMALGGGCEVCLGAGHVYAAAETYIGLVELGVGLIPAGGGCKEMLVRHLEGMPRIEGTEAFPFVRAAFETIGLARVATSAEEAKQLRILRPADGITLHPHRVIHYAKAMALGLASQGYRAPDPTIRLPVAGEAGLASLKTHLYLLKEGKHISEYDEYLGGELATILCGGRLRAGTLVGEQHILDLEREVFLRLCGQRKTLERMQHMLKKGKPLRN